MRYTKKFVEDSAVNRGFLRGDAQEVQPRLKDRDLVNLSQLPPPDPGMRWVKVEDQHGTRLEQVSTAVKHKLDRRPGCQIPYLEK